MGSRVGTGVASSLESTIAASFAEVYKAVSSTARTVKQATHASKKPNSDSLGIPTQPNSWSNASTSCDSFCNLPIEGTCKYRDLVTSRSGTLVLLSQNNGSVIQQPMQCEEVSNSQRSRGPASVSTTSQHSSSDSSHLRLVELSINRL